MLTFELSKPDVLWANISNPVFKNLAVNALGCTGYKFWVLSTILNIVLKFHFPNIWHLEGLTKQNLL